MNCKKCGNEINKGAIICTNCGAKVKKPIFKKVWFWIALAIAVIIVIAISGGDSNETSKSKSEKPQSSTTQTDTDKMSVSQLYGDLENNENIPYTMSDKAEKFISEHEDCFPSTNYSHISQYVDTSIDYRHVSKNPENYGNKLMELQELYVIGIDETNIDEERKFTEIQACDIDENIYYILYNDSIDIFEDDIIKATFLPLGMTSYENLDGGTTIALVTAGSYIEKVE